MVRWLRLGALALTLGGFAACGNTDTELAKAYDPLNGTNCSPQGTEKNGCTCASDGRWICGGQNSVTCSSIYGSGGGRLLVSAEMPCEMQWGWMSGCDDGRVYRVDCDGLECHCFAGGDAGRSWFTPRCAEIGEADAQCGWSLKYPDGDGVGNGPAQGHACETVGEHDAETDCTCTQYGWDCQAVASCVLSGAWLAGTSRLAIAPYGTLFYGSASVNRDEILTGAAPGFVGTWELAPPYVYFRSTHSPPDASCDGTFGTYSFAFDEACGTLTLTRVDDACASRAAALGEFSGSR